MSDETKRLGIEAIEARAKRDVVPCDTCGAPATKECSESECRTSRCEAHAVFFDGHCTHRWWRRDSRPAETLDLVAEVRRLRAIIDGRNVPPTDAEIDAHRAAGGGWIVGDRPFYLSVEVRDARSLCERRAALHVAEPPMWPPYRWIALDADGRPCAWPTVPT